MGRLSDILNGHGGNFNDQWNTTEAARDRRAASDRSARLNRATLDFITNGPGLETGIGCCSRRRRISPSSAARASWLMNC